MHRRRDMLFCRSNGAEDYLPDGLHRAGIPRCGIPARACARRIRLRRTLPRIPPGLPGLSGTRRRGDPEISDPLSGLHDSRHLPPPSESGPLQRQHRRADQDSGSRARSRGAGRRYRNRERGELREPPGASALGSLPGAFLSQLRRHSAAPGIGAAAHGRDPGARLQDRHHGAKAVRQFARAVAGAVASEDPDGSAGDGRNRIPHARAFARVRRPVHLRRAEHGRGNRVRASEREEASRHVSRGKTFARREDLRRDRRSGGALDFAGRA